VTTPASSHAITESRQRVPAIVHVLNPLIQRLLRAGMPMGPNVVLTVRGRTSGRAIDVPVALLEAGGRRFVQSPFGEVQWTRNLRATPEAILKRGRDEEAVTARALPPEEAAAVLRYALARFLRMRAGRWFLGHYYAVRLDSSDADYLHEASEHPVFELRPVQA